MKKLLLSGLSAAILLGSFNAAWAEDAPKTVNIGYQKANIFALLKYRGTLDSDFSKQGITVRWVEFPAGPQMLEGLNVGSIDLAATATRRRPSLRPPKRI
ncbi:Putative aliphatic sulfonates-binding protein precursor [Ewingella americana]|uniref:Aliphatic sulfonates-binding protein n=1 Tax=Ewingella americana TaxID=41202 RepID=A0A377NJ27_9GAMM|nr:Putative aliphatic sulfonates-binding protein precursor [Ewingella americana]